MIGAWASSDTIRVMRRDALLKRLSYLRDMEGLNIVLIPSLLCVTLAALEVAEWTPYLLAMALICLILAEGTWYWHLKLNAVRQGRLRLPAVFRPAFTAARWVNGVLLVAYPIWYVATREASAGALTYSIWPILLYVFAILEHINYFDWQLSHDNRADLQYLLTFRRLRRAPLYEDLRRGSQES